MDLGPDSAAPGWLFKKKSIKMYGNMNVKKKLFAL
jgi:hypothetical protein